MLELLGSFCVGCHDRLEIARVVGIKLALNDRGNLFRFGFIHRLECNVYHNSGGPPAFLRAAAISPNQFTKFMIVAFGLLVIEWPKSFMKRNHVRAKLKRGESSVVTW